MTALSVNLNKIALLRNSRGRNYPSLSQFAEAAIKSGAHGLTIHPRPDQRHARFDDISQLKTLCTKYNVELNIEGYPSSTFIQSCIDNHVDQVTLVPDTAEQITSDHGWIVSENQELLLPIITQLGNASIRTSLFMDTDLSEIKKAKEIGADRIELHTESYARSVENNTHETHINSFIDAYQTARNCGLGVNAGHDLNLQNLAFFLSKLAVDEVSIGHALTIESLNNGWNETIKQYHLICTDGS